MAKGKRPRGRPRKAPEDQRAHMVAPRFDQAEFDAIKRAVAQAGYFMPAEWAREVLLREARDPRPEQ